MVINKDSNCHDKCFPVITARRVLLLRMKKRPPIWRVAANILNNSRGQPTRAGPPAWGLGKVLSTPHRRKLALLLDGYTYLGSGVNGSS